jgi:hypothetical protein
MVNALGLNFGHYFPPFNNSIKTTIQIYGCRNPALALPMPQFTLLFGYPCATSEVLQLPVCALHAPATV